MYLLIDSSYSAYMHLNEDDLTTATDLSRSSGSFLQEASKGRRIVVIKDNVPTAFLGGMDDLRRLDALDSMGVMADQPGPPTPPAGVAVVGHASVNGSPVWIQVAQHLLVVAERGCPETVSAALARWVTAPSRPVELFFATAGFAAPEILHSPLEGVSSAHATVLGVDLDDKQEADRFVAQLEGRYRYRRDLLKSAGMASMAQYRRSTPDAREKDLIAIVELFREPTANLAAALNKIASRGTELGMYLWLFSRKTPSSWIDVRGFSQRIAHEVRSVADSRLLVSIPDAALFCDHTRLAYILTPDLDTPYRFSIETPDLELGGGYSLTNLGPNTPSLDHVVSLDELPSVGTPLKVPIGLIDDLYPCSGQRSLAIDFSSPAGNTVITGGPQSGKSTTLQTLVLSAAQRLSSSQIQFYCLDFSDGKLLALKDLAHVGTVATPQEAETVSRIIAEITAACRRREQLFKELQINSITDFRQRKSRGELTLESDKHAADIVLVIDGWNIRKAEFEEHLEAVNKLAEHGPSYGIHVAAAVARPSDMALKLRQNFPTTVELKLADSMDSQVGRQAADAVPKGKPGRGTMLSDREGDNDFAAAEALHFLIALPARSDSVDKVPLSTRVVVDVDSTLKTINATNPVSAPPVKLLPKLLQRNELMVHAMASPDKPEITPGRATNLVVPLGIGELELTPQYVDFNNASQTHMVLYSDPDCGKTTGLRHIIKTLTEQNTPDDIRLVVVDYRRELLGALPDEYGQYVSKPSDLGDVVFATREGLQSRLPKADITPKELRERSWWNGPDLFFIVDDTEQVLRQGDPFLPIIDMLPQGRDVGLHFIAAHRTNGVGRAQFGNNIIGELTRMCAPGVLMSGPKEEGPVLGGLKPGPQPPGRGHLVIGSYTQLIQMPIIEPDL